MKLFTLKDRMTIFAGTLIWSSAFGLCGYAIGYKFGNAFAGLLIGVIASIVPAQISITKKIRKDAEARFQKHD